MSYWAYSLDVVFFIVARQRKKLCCAGLVLYKDSEVLNDVMHSKLDLFT